MRLPPSRPANGLVLSSVLFPALIAAMEVFDCSKIVTEENVWDLSKLGGPRSVTHTLHTPPSWHNTTYTIDICKSLVDAPKGDGCPSGTRVCAIEHTLKPDDGVDEITAVIPIAGDLKDSGGGSLDAKSTSLITAGPRKDSDVAGLIIELNGGIYGDPERKQKAIVKFLCDPNQTGTEPDLSPKARQEVSEGMLNIETTSLKFVDYERNRPNTDVDILSLEWYTEYACERSTEDGAAKGRHWGFFTWFLIIAFLVTAAYLIFGSWLNYNRYGARGWDLLPHGDTIRDVPYLLKDWTRRVVNTVQGSGSRGGYSAV